MFKFSYHFSQTFKHWKSPSLSKVLSLSDRSRVAGDETLVLSPALFVASTVANIVSPLDRP